MSKVLSIKIDNADIAMLSFAMNSAISERGHNASPDAVRAYKDLWRRIKEGIKEDENVMSEKKPNIKPGDIAVYYDGLFRVKKVNKRTDETGYEYYEVHIGNLVVPATEVHKADFRDEVRILKRAPSNSEKTPKNNDKNHV